MPEIEGFVHDLDVLIRARYPPMNVVFPEIPSLEKEIKTIDLPLPDEREVPRLLDPYVEHFAARGDVAIAVDQRTREQLIQALLGLTEIEIENALAKAFVTNRGLGPSAVGVILEEKHNVI